MAHQTIAILGYMRMVVPHTVRFWRKQDLYYSYAILVDKRFYFFNWVFIHRYLCTLKRGADQRRRIIAGGPGVGLQQHIETLRKEV